MFTAYIAVALLAAAANGYAATLDFLRHQKVLASMARLGLPERWLPLLGILKAAGARTAGRHRRAGDRNSCRSRARPVLCRRDHHAPACTRLLAWPGGRVPLAGHGCSGIAMGLVSGLRSRP